MSKKMLATMMVAVFLLSTLMPMLLWSGDSDAAKEELIVETSPDFAPYDYYYGKEFAGIDMDILRAVGKDIGATIKFRQNSFDSIIMSVQQGKCDFGASGFTINDERKEMINFTESYAVIKQVVVAKIGKGFSSPADLYNATISVQTGTSGADYADAHVKDVSQITYQKGYPEIVLDLLNGKADCEVVDDAVAAAQVAAHPDKLQVYDVLDDSEPEYYGFVFSKSNTALYERVNNSLIKLKADGVVDSIIKYYADNDFSPDTPPFYTDKTLVVETSPDFAPYDYYYGTEFSGIDMDILRAIGRDIGYNIQFRQNSFDSIIMSVQQHKCDFGASGFTISDERKAMIDFTDSYAVIKQVVVAKKGLDISSSADLHNMKISVQTGTSGADYAAEHVKNVSQIIYQKGYPEIVLDLLNNKADCEVVDDAVAYAQVAAYPDTLQVYEILEDAEPEYYGFVFAKDRKDTFNLVNESLKKLKSNGTVARIQEYYAQNNYSPDTPSYFSQEPTLYVVTDKNDTPFDYLYHGRDAGIEIDVMKKVAEKLDYKLVIVHRGSEDLLEMVQNSSNVVAAAGFTSVSDLGSGVAFTKTYLTDGLSIVSKLGSEVSDIDGKKTAVIAESESDTYISGTGAVRVAVSSLKEASEMLLAGEIDCIVAPSIDAKSLCSLNPNKFATHAILGQSEAVHHVFAVSADNEVLMDTINGALTELMEDGTVEKVNAYYENNGYAMSAISLYTSSENQSWWDKLVDRFTRDFLNMDRYEYILTGLKNTLKITGLALVIGIIIGVLAATFMSVYAMTGKLVIPNYLCRLYVTVIRGTPVMVQLLLIYYVVFASVNMNQILVAAFAFGINSGAYVAEIVRSGMNSVPKGQMEAAKSLGLSTPQSMVSIVIPQAIRNILPALGNEGISLIKETSIAGYIGVMELTRGADIIRGQTYDALLPLLVIAVIYLAIVLVLQFLIRKLEKRLNNAY